MTDDRTGPDYSGIIRSPYDPEPDEPDRSEGSSDLPWVPAVVAAVLGALVASVFVVFAVVSGPDAEADEVTESTATTSTQPPPVQSSEVPPGFVAVTEQVGADVVSVTASPDSTIVAIATAVTGGADPATIEPLDVAYWALESGGSINEMVEQYSQRGALGNSTVEFSPLAISGEATLTPWVGTGESSDSVVIELDSTVPQVVSSQRLEVGDAVVLVEELSIGDGWGWVDWSVEEGTVARVETIVTFIDTDDPATEDVDPTTLTPAHLRTISQGSGSRPLPPLYGFSGSEQLVRSGEPLGASNPHTAIEVEFRVTVPLDVSPRSPIDLPPTN